MTAKKIECPMLCASFHLRWDDDKPLDDGWARVDHYGVMCRYYCPTRHEATKTNPNIVVTHKREVEVIPELTCWVKGCGTKLIDWQTGAAKRIDRPYDIPLCPEHSNTWWSRDDMDLAQAEDYGSKKWEEIE